MHTKLIELTELYSSLNTRSQGDVKTLEDILEDPPEVFIDAVFPLSLCLSVSLSLSLSLFLPLSLCFPVIRTKFFDSGVALSY